MRDFEHLTCPACGEPSDRPLRTFVTQPKWRCTCGFSVMLPATKSMLARIELAKNIVRFGDSPE
jgi:hypothetical protein